MKAAYDKKFLASQTNKLLQIKNDILNKITENGLEEIQVDKDQTTEDGDQAQAYQNQNLSFGLMERDIEKLKGIDIALAKISNGSYGICEETDEFISKKRLEKMPWAKLCIEAAEQIEKNQGGVLLHYGA